MGWILESFGEGALAKGWQSTLTFPREQFLQVINNVVPDSLANEAPSSWAIVDSNTTAGTVRLETLGIRMVPELDALRNGSPFAIANTSFPANTSSNYVALSQQPTSRFYYLSAKITFAAGTGAAGFTIFRSPDGSEQTSIYYDASKESFLIDRSNSSAVTSYNAAIGYDSAKFRLFNVKDPVTGVTARQSLDLTIVVDNSVIEVRAILLIFMNCH